MSQTKIESDTTLSSSKEGVFVDTDLLFLVDRLDEADVERIKTAQRAYKGFPAGIAKAWLDLGYGLIPLDKDLKKPQVSFGWIKDTERGHTEKCLQEEILDGAFSLSARAGLVLDGLKGSLVLSVMDLDVAGQEAEARSRLPVTPLEVSTGREGGGRHFYYLRDPKNLTRGSRTGLSTVGCDFKGHNGYVVAAGSVHASGLVYKAYWMGQEIAPDSITEEMIASLPVLPDDLVQVFIDEDVQARAVAKVDEAAKEVKTGFFELEMTASSKAGKVLGHTKNGDARVRVDPDGEVIRHGVYKGLTASQAASKLGPGAHSICCPHHEHTTDRTGGTAFKMNVGDSGAPSHGWCFAENMHFFYRDQAREREISKWALSDEVLRELHIKIKEEAKVIKAEREASEARYLSSPKGKADAKHRQALLESPEVLDQVQPEILAEDAARITAGVIADLSDPPAKEPLSFGSGRLPESEIDMGVLENLCGDSAECPIGPLDKTMGAQSDKLGKRPAVDPIPAHLVELALSRYRELGCSCKRGPTAVQPGSGTARAFGLACWARTCEVCGPRGRRAERAAISGSVEALGEGWAMARMHSRPDEKSIRRWAGDGINRIVLVVKLSPTEDLTLLGWAPGHGPETRMSRRLDAALPVKTWADLLFEQIKEDVHPAEGIRAVQGTQWLTKQVFALKKELLRIKRKDPLAPTGGTLITNAKIADVFKAILNALGPDFYEAINPEPRKPSRRGVQEIEIMRVAKGEFGSPDWKPGGPATPEELTWACEHAEIFKGRHPKGSDLFGYFDLEMSA